jgi:hypothetical protein
VTDDGLGCCVCSRKNVFAPASIFLYSELEHRLKPVCWYCEQTYPWCALARVPLEKGMADYEIQEVMAS